MRLNQNEIQAIKKSILSLDEKAEIFLFGSRTDPASKGGDIDILVLSQSLTFNDKLKIKQLIFNEIDEQKVDLLIARDTSSPFVRMAFKKGVRIA